MISHLNNMVLVIAIALSGCHGHEAAAPPEPDATAGADGPAVVLLFKLDLPGLVSRDHRP